MTTTAQNRNLGDARRAKNDEFYTQLHDIAAELRHYPSHFKDKTVLCNCDDPKVSMFFHYFSHRFNELGLKKLIAVCYKNGNAEIFSPHDCERAIWLEYNGELFEDRIPDPDEIGINQFQGDGDFRSAECIALLKQADIVVTNPPFSKFREYVKQLVEFDKKFLIVGNFNAITYKDIFKFIKAGKVWLGHGFNRNCAHFINMHYVDYASDTDHKEGMIRVSGVAWFTNLEHHKRHEPLPLTQEYDPAKYPKYDNYNAINVDKVKDIPVDYDGVMGVPVTFMDKYCPEQFEILGAETFQDIETSPGVFQKPNYKLANSERLVYKRIWIKHKRG